MTAFEHKSIHAGREVKKVARERNLSVAGPGPKGFKDIAMPRLEEKVNEEIAAHTEWVNKEFYRFARALEWNTSKVSYEDLLKAFRKTLGRRFRLYAKVSGQNIENLAHDPSQMDSLTTSAAFDFLLSLRSSLRHGFSYPQAVALAELTHWTNPHEIEALVRGASRPIDVDVARNAITKRPRDPSGYLEDEFTLHDRLTEKYGSDVDAGFIINAVRSHMSTADAYLDACKAEIPRLWEQYGARVELGTIKHFVRGNPKTAEEQILAYIPRLHALHEEHTDLQYYIIRRIAVDYSRDPEKGVREYRESIRILDRLFGDRVEKSLMTQVALTRPKRPVALMESCLGLLDLLKVKYPDVPGGASVLERAAFFHTERSAEFVEWYIDGHTHLRNEFPNATHIRELLLTNAFASRNELEQLMRGRES